MNKMSPEEETLFQEHLISCPTCRRKLQEMRNLAAALSANHPNSLAKREYKKRHFVKILVSILLFSPEVTASTCGAPTPRKKKSFLPYHPTFFTTRTLSKLRTHLKSQETRYSKPLSPTSAFSTSHPTVEPGLHPGDLYIKSKTWHIQQRNISIHSDLLLEKAIKMLIYCHQKANCSYSAPILLPLLS